MHLDEKATVMKGEARAVGGRVHGRCLTPLTFYARGLTGGRGGGP